MALPTPAQERLLLLLRHGAMDAQAMAGRLDIDASAVRRHLAALEGMGLVTSQDLVHGRGRPRKMYALTPLARERGPRNYPLLLALLMRKVSDRHGRKELLRELEGIARDLAGPASKVEPARVRLDLLLAEYRRLGFEPELEVRGGEAVLTQRNCPFMVTAQGDPEALCLHLDEGILRAALPGHRVTLLDSMAQGAPLCRHRIALGVEAEVPGGPREDPGAGRGRKG